MTQFRKGGLVRNFVLFVCFFQLVRMKNERIRRKREFGCSNLETGLGRVYDESNVNDW